VQVAEHKRAVDKLLEDKRAMYEAARAAEEQEAATKYVHTSLALSKSSMDVAPTDWMHDKRQHHTVPSVCLDEQCLSSCHHWAALAATAVDA
jgi:hypothetical protein